jgi:hypothetical protein
MLDIFRETVRTFPHDGKLPGTGYTIKGLGKRQGEDAIVYLVPNREDPTKPFPKGVSASELRSAYGRLLSSGEFTRRWFNSAMRECAKCAPCNFLAMGAVFVGLKLADKKHGLFTLRRPVQGIE